MKISYDSKIDALYIKLAKGKVLGIEILDATKNINAFDPQKLIHL